MTDKDIAKLAGPHIKDAFDPKPIIEYFTNSVMNESAFFEKLRAIVCQGCTNSIFAKDSEGIEGTCRATFDDLIKCMTADYKDYQRYIDEDEFRG